MRYEWVVRAFWSEFAARGRSFTTRWNSRGTAWIRAGIPRCGVDLGDGRHRAKADVGEEGISGRAHGTGLLRNYGRKPSKIIWSACWMAALRCSGVRTVQVNKGQRSKRRAARGGSVVRS